MCVWDFSRPEAPSVLTFESDAFLEGGFPPIDAAYFVRRMLGGRSPTDPFTFVMEERRAADGSVPRSAFVGSDRGSHGGFPQVERSPDDRALLLRPFDGAPARVVMFH